MNTFKTIGTFSGFIGLLFCLNAWAADDTTYCPEPSSLHKEDMRWYSSQGGWHSYDASFVDQIGAFSGAQWIGVQLGKIICIYQGIDEFSFPVTIERDNLVDDIKPDMGLWSQDLGGYKACQSDQVKDCGFIMHQKKAVTDIYQEIRNLKKP